MNLTKPREQDLIQWIGEQSQNLPASMIKHIGDDCAAFDPRSYSKLAVTADILLENVHFRRRSISPYFLGRKSLLVNLSDLAAVGARPYACLLALALPEDLTEGYFDSFMKGFLEEGARWDAPLIGGDLSQSSTIFVSVTAWGSFQKGRPLWRSGAQEGDIVGLIGEIGFSRLALKSSRQKASLSFGRSTVKIRWPVWWVMTFGIGASRPIYCHSLSFMWETGCAKMMLSMP